MNLSLSSLKIAGFPLLILALVTIVNELPVKAQELTPPSSLKAEPSSDETQNQALTKKATQVIDLLNQKKYDDVRKAISPTLAVELTTAQIGKIWENLIETTGPVKKQASDRVISTINADLVVVKAEFENKTDEFILTFNKQGEIIGIDFPNVASIEDIAKIVVNALAANDFPQARGYLHSSLKTEIFPKQVQDKWSAVQKENGLFEGIVSTQMHPGSSVDKVNVVVVKGKFQKGIQEFFFVFDENSRIVGIDITE